MIIGYLMKKTKIFLATRNKAKYPFLKKICDNVNCRFITPYDIDLDLKVEESGGSILENAEIKAKAWSSHADGIVLANDCGFDIPALKTGWKKEFSKRNVGGDEASDDEKRERLLAVMKKLKGKGRKIIWTEAIALAFKGKLLGSIEYDSTPGYIIEKLDPKIKIITGEFSSNLELKPHFGKIYSELTDKEIEETDKEMFKKFREFVKNKVKEFQNEK